ncbi:MAG: DUF3048 domain-containing protein [Lachnospiraceae bacterium]|nr:DUF3048 domain-containing protein [Lachnospiraceae bacterium]
MKKHILAALAVSISLSLCACSSSGNKEASASPSVQPVSESVPSSSAVSDQNGETITDAPPAPGMVRSRITNEWVSEEQNNTRPIALMVPTSSTASHFGLSKASVLYEANVEGEMTRLMAVIDDWQDDDKLGNIRSCRDYFLYWSFEWDSIYIHFGGPWYIYDVLGRQDTDNIDCIAQPDVGKYNNAYVDVVFRDAAKNETDNAFTSAKRIKEACDHLGISLKYRDGYCDYEHFKFAPFDSPNTLDQYPNAIKAEKIDLSEAYPNTNTFFLYNEETGTYDRYQRFPKGTEEAHIDLANNEQLTFKNVIIQNTYYEVRDDKGYLAFQCHDTTKDGWYFTNGKAIHITWKKEADYSPTKYYDDNGDQVEFNTGKTMILIVEDGDSFKIDDKEYSSKKNM